ncbi:hypothetical protein CDAR_593541 [Caerostris darwini]|uniref:Uncharacterized protein n=1 Tax=Caerostris darwini TaxID=1538125 RepID=A0AAV4RZ09_9ARAC|nr:hypothetical protein CDAR_593541 [Caerostris darwini]
MAQSSFFSPFLVPIARSNRGSLLSEGRFNIFNLSIESVAASSAAPLPVPPLGGSVSTARSVFWGLRDFQLWPPNFETDVWEKKETGEACCRGDGLTFLICSPESVAASSAAPLPMPPLGGSVSTARSVFWGLGDFQLWPPNFETDVWEKKDNLPSAFLQCTKPLADIVCLASPLYFSKRELINVAQRDFFFYFPLPLLIARSNREARCRRGGLTFLICSPESVAASSAAPLPMPPLGGSVSTARSVFWGLGDFQLWPPNFETDVWEKEG